jgi:hypothetical protein
MEQFLVSLQPIDMNQAETIIQKPFHELSFQARTLKGGAEIGRCKQWKAPTIENQTMLTAKLPSYWLLESVGIANGETQFVYWDPKHKVYSLWALKQKGKKYYPTHSWIKNYSLPKRIKNFEIFTHPHRGTVVVEKHEEEGDYIVYIFRGKPATTPDIVEGFFDI